MSTNYNFKKEWEETKKKLVKFSKEASDIAKKGEAELIKISQKSKLHIDSTAITLKKEKLYYVIGKEYSKSKNLTKPSAKVLKLIEELKAIEKEQKALKDQLKKTERRKKAR